MKNLVLVSVLVLVALIVVACTSAPAPSAPQVVKETVIVQATAAPAVATKPAAPPAATAAPAPVALGARFAAVKARGKVVCGSNDQVPGFGFLDKATGQFTGFDVDYCKALAVAVFGDAKAIEFRPVNAAQRGPALQTGEIDVLARNTTWTVTRDATWGLFAGVNFYDGQGMMVDAKKNPTVKTLKDLKDASVCVQTGTTTELNLSDRFREEAVAFKPVVFDTADATFAAYEGGRCDAVTTDISGLVARRSLLKSPADHKILEVVMSKEPLGPAVPLGDAQWYNVAKWTLFALINAEELGVTSKNVDEMLQSKNPDVQRLLGVTGDLHKGLGLEKDWVVKVIKAVGNYGEIYDRHLGPSTPLKLDRGINKLWNKGGILYAPPFR